MLPVSQIGRHHFDEKFFLPVLFLLLFCLLLSCLGVLPKRPPVEGKVPVWCPSAEQSPVLGTVGPRDKFWPRKNGTPQSGSLEIHARVEQVVLFQDDRKHHQEFRQSSFPFSGRTFTSSPSECKRFPPEKNPKTHGVLASQDSVPQGMSHGCP